MSASAAQTSWVGIAGARDAAVAVDEVELLGAVRLGDAWGSGDGGVEGGDDIGDLDGGGGGVAGEEGAGRGGGGWTTAGARARAFGGDGGGVGRCGKAHGRVVAGGGGA